MKIEFGRTQSVIFAETEFNFARTSFFLCDPVPKNSTYNFKATKSYVLAYYLLLGHPELVRH